MSSSPPDEAVGTLLVHQQDLKELSTPSLARQEPDEAIGTLLVHQTDLRELSDVAAPKIGMPGNMHLREREAVGTLLVEPGDLKSPPEQEEQVASLRHRITESLNKPAPKDEDDEATQEAEWAYRDI